MASPRWLWPLVILLLSWNDSASMATANSRTQARSRASNTRDEGSDENEARMFDDLASHLHTTNVWTWLKKPDEVLATLKVGDDVLSYLESQRVELLAKVLSEKVETSSRMQQSLVKIFMQRFGDIALARALYTASQSEVELTKNVARELAKRQFEVWLERNDSVDNIVSLMRAQGDLEVMSEQNVKVLKGYISVYNERNGQITLGDALAKGFGGWAKFLHQLTTAESLKDQASADAWRLKNLLFAEWTDKKVQLEDVLLWLKVDENLDLLTMSTGTIVMQYIAYFNSKNPNHMLSLLTALSAHHDDAAVSEVLAKMYQVPHMKAFARGLRSAQLVRWLESNKSVGEVFALLNMKSGGYKNFDLDRFKALQLYETTYWISKDEKVNLINILSHGYDDDNVFALVIMKLSDELSESKLIQALKTPFKQWARSSIKPEELRANLVQAAGGNSDHVSRIVDMYQRFYDRMLEKKHTPQFMELRPR